MILLAFIIAGVSAYLLGSIPFGYLAGLSRGVDIRTVGSGNIGATNVFRTLGRKLGVATFVLDVSKGLAGAGVIPQIAWYAAGRAGAAPQWLSLACGVMALVGHSFPLFLGFRGGKGVASGLGVLIGIAPQTAAVGLLVWLVVFLSTRYVSVGSIAAACTVAVAVWFLDGAAEGAGALVPSVVSVLAALIVVKHRTNIKRLIAGNENRFDFSRRKAK